MCIFTREPKSVTSTQILVVGLEAEKQFTVYANQVSSSQGTAMILPFPNSKLEGCQLIDLSKYENLFTDLKNIFSPPRKSRARKWSEVNKVLDVVQVGSYKCSVANCLSDLQKLNATAFGLDEKEDKSEEEVTIGLPKRIYDELEAHYARDFGFIVCRIDQNAKFSPFGYIHQTWNERHFIPTLHDHGDQDPKWDHVIYAFGAKSKYPTLVDGDSHELEKNCKATFQDSDKYVEMNDHLRLSALPKQFPKKMKKNEMKKWVIKGHQKFNTDLYF